MYESPIKVFQGNLEMQFEGEILKAVQRADITVDRDELIRALRYDREQYQKGFDDARKDAVPVVHGRWEREPSSYWRWTSSGAVAVTRTTYRCGLYGRGTAVKSNYCPHCGAKMDGGDENG